ncbi:superoxide dismutase, Ni [Halosquirtibacter xylanolyticus]|uniref:superoxide dismutase [Ni] n=1 Tax=Halosquirtibacter xylanolyticus TaxID=3374599 RepID=UPI003749FF53|nr:superoxide dismutase, Ni [Prolixibacteraceae bacterium]
MKIKSLLLLAYLTLGMTMIMPKPVQAHCEIPCGIYDDALRIKLIKEHIQTIKKSMHEIDHLSTQSKTDLQQIVRWTNNKEDHAKKVQEIMTQYFLFQRVKLGTNDATKKRQEQLLLSLHEVCVYAMKCKQSLDYKMVDKLQAATEKFEKLYFNK